jgi:hypothetical protein
MPGALAGSTIGRVFNGQTLPRWRVIRSVLQAMSAEEIDNVWRPAVDRRLR